MGRRGSLKLRHLEEGKKAVFEAKIYKSTVKGYVQARITVPHYIAESFLDKIVKVTIETIP